MKKNYEQPASNKKNVVHEDKIITTNDGNAKILNSFFSTLVQHLKIPEFKDIDFSAEWISNSALKAITKFWNHPNVSAIGNLFNPQSFCFLKVSVDVASKEIKQINIIVIQNTEIPIKTLK